MKRIISLIFAFTCFIMDVYPQNNASPTIVDNYSRISIIDENLKKSESIIIKPVKNHFVILQRKPQGISVVDNQGEVVTRLGNKGRGPFEWQQPKYIQYKNEKIIIWDAGNLKFLIFDNNFNEFSELSGIKHSIRGFTIKDSSHLVVYHQPRYQNDFIKLYQLENNNLVLSESLGELSNEGRTLLFISKSGGILWNNNDMIWVDPSISEINVYNFLDKSIKKIPFEDDLFKVEPWKEQGKFNNETLNKIQEYIFSNSRIVSLQKLEEHILVEMEHFPDGEPVMTYQIFDLNYNFVGRIEAGEGDWVNYIRGSDGNRLFYWGEDYTETGEMNSIKVKELIFD